MNRFPNIPAVAVSALMCIAFPAMGQTDVALSGAVNFPSSTFDYSRPAWLLAGFWDPGVSVGASIETHLSRVITLVPSLEYASYPWRNGTTPAWDPQIYNVPTGPGAASRMYRFFADVRFYVFSKERFGIFLSTGAGYVIEKLGSYSLGPRWVLYTASDYVDGRVQHPVVYYWAHDMGVGTHFFLAGNIGLDFTAKYFSNYTDRFHTSLSLGVFYRIAE